MPHADVDCCTIPDVVSDMDALFLSDAGPTGFMGADLCDINPADTVAVWGCGGVGLMAQQSARLLGAEGGRLRAGRLHTLEALTLGRDGRGAHGAGGVG